MGTRADPVEPILLVHGVFGAGKSTTLVALAMLLAELGQLPGVRLRKLSCDPAAESSAALKPPRVFIVSPSFHP
jgi:Mrp family chromosome partitioning ATPase